MSSTTVTRGNSHETFYIQPSLTPILVSASTTALQSFSLPGLQATDIVQVIGYNGTQTTGVVIAEADCLAANVLSVQFGNTTAGNVTPASGTYTIQVVRLEGPAPVTAV
jgi:predicted peptidase